MQQAGLSDQKVRATIVPSAELSATLTLVALTHTLRTPCKQTSPGPVPSTAASPSRPRCGRAVRGGRRVCTTTRAHNKHSISTVMLDVTVDLAVQTIRRTQVAHIQAGSRYRKMAFPTLQCPDGARCTTKFVQLFFPTHRHHGAGTLEGIRSATISCLLPLYSTPQYCICCILSGAACLMPDRQLVYACSSQHTRGLAQQSHHSACPEQSWLHHTVQISVCSG